MTGDKISTFHRFVAYTVEEVKKVDGSWEHLATVIGFDTTKEIIEIFYKNPTYKAIILEYCNGRDSNGGNEGLPNKGGGRITTIKTFLDLLTKAKFKTALATAQPPKIDDLDEIPRADFSSLITLWYGYRLITTVPAMFPATQDRPDFDLDPYDALHAFFLLKTYHSKRHTAQQAKKAGRKS